MNNFELEKRARNIPFFRGIYMRDALPKAPRINESGIINLHTSRQPGSHWVCYIKRGNYIFYFDSFGNLSPPKELIKYFRPRNKLFFYNKQRHQSYNSKKCGEYCLNFLKTYSKHFNHYKH